MREGCSQCLVWNPVQKRCSVVIKSIILGLEWNLCPTTFSTGRKSKAYTTTGDIALTRDSTLHSFRANVHELPVVLPSGAGIGPVVWGGG